MDRHPAPLAVQQRQEACQYRRRPEGDSDRSEDNTGSSTPRCKATCGKKETRLGEGIGDRPTCEPGRGERGAEERRCPPRWRGAETKWDSAKSQTEARDDMVDPNAAPAGLRNASTSRVRKHDGTQRIRIRPWRRADNHGGRG